MKNINEKIKVFVKENTWLNRDYVMDFGWGNGYVTIPKGHELYGKSYDEIHDLIPSIEINGGLTFADYAESLEWEELPENSNDSWIIGFDTAHSWDTLEMWGKENVMKEAEKLREQIINFTPPTNNN